MLLKYYTILIMEIYNLIYDKLIKYTPDNGKIIIFFFSIGSFPHHPESNHETPKIYSYLKDDPRFEIVRILIDPEYSKYSDDRINTEFGQHTFVIKKTLTSREYYMIMDFCCLIGETTENLSLIFEFTGHIRDIESYNRNKVFISNTDCLADTDTIQYNPVIQNSFGNDIRIDKSITIDIGYKFYNINESDLLYINIKDMIAYDKFDSNINKIEYVRYYIIRNLLKIKSVYRKMLCFMKVKEDFVTSFTKTSPNYDKSVNKVLYRMSGYYKSYGEKVISSFNNSSYNTLESYIYDKIKDIFTDCIFLKYNGNISQQELNALEIDYSNDKQLKLLYDEFESFFEEEIVKNKIGIDL